MPNDNDSKVSWWGALDMQEKLLDDCAKHIVGLGVVTNTLEYTTYTGVILEWAGLSLWLTAGHVIDNLNDVCRHFGDGLKAQWIDTHETPAASHISVDPHSIVRFSLRAYPKTPAARNVIHAQANWSSAT
jgi:hypothetical protein